MMRGKIGHPKQRRTGWKSLLPLLMILGLCLGTAGPADAWLGVKVGGQFAGSMSASPDLNLLGIAIPVPSFISAGEAVQPSWSVAVEGDVPLGDHFALGGGVQYLANRGLSNSLMPGYFSFLPVYGQAQAILTGKDSKFRPYIKAQLGYNWFFWTEAFENTVQGNWEAAASTLSNITGNSKGGGIYWSAGLGAYIFKYLMVELMYMECRGNYSIVDSSLASVDVGGTYRNVAFYAGFHF